MTTLELMVRLLLVIFIAALIGICTGNDFIVQVCGAGLGIGFLGLIWAWFASHKIFVLPGVIVSKVRYKRD